MRYLDKNDTYQVGINKIAIDKYDTAKAWMCSYNQGMISVNWKTKQVERIYNDVAFARRLYDFAQITKKRWLLASQKELIEWSPETGPKLRIKLPVPDSIALVCNIRRIIVADTNTCYITTNYGLFKYDLPTRRICAASAASVRRSGGDPLPYILLEGLREKGTLWIASRNGVFRYNLADGSVDVRREKGNFGDYFLFDVTNTAGDDLVCAAGQGITIFNKKTAQYRVVNRLGNLDRPGCLCVFALRNTVWIGTDQGILTYDLESGKSREAQLSRSLGDIFPTSPFALIGKQLVYGFRNGFAYFKPETRDNQTPSDPLIERVFVNNHPVTQSDHNSGVVFTYAENSFNFFFTAFLYNYPEDIRFRFRLKGIDKSWQNVDNQRSANYAQLPPGGYTFYVQSGNKNGFWNRRLASFTFTIDPPYWATWWFRTLVAVAIGLGLYRLYRYKIEHLQAIEKIRENIAADFHDDLGSTLSSISIFSQVAIQKAETDLPATKSMMGDIGTRARAMIQSMNDMVWIIKPENDSLFKLMQRMEEFGYPVAEAREVPLSFVMDKGLYDVKLDMLTRKNLFLIFKESFNNAIKYASAKNITVLFELRQKKMLTIQIADNGCGFEYDSNARGNGLGNMQKRATELRGKLKIIAAPGKGTTIQVMCEIT
jgi:signal transduction histidine kinase